MAIKGKKKRTGGKPRSVAPRRAVVERKPPILARRWIQITAIGLVALALGLALGWGFGKDAGIGTTRPLNKAEDARVRQYQATVDPLLQASGRTSPPVGYAAFPELATSADKFKKGNMSSAAFAKLASQASKQAKDTAGKVQGVGLAAIAKGMPAQTSNDLFNSQQQLSQGFLLYQQVATMYEEATRASGSQRAYLLAKATTLRGMADTMIQEGYSAYIGALTAAGLGPPALPTLPQTGGLPVVPGGSSP